MIAWCALYGFEGGTAKMLRSPWIDLDHALEDLGKVAPASSRILLIVETDPSVPYRSTPANAPLKVRVHEKSKAYCQDASVAYSFAQDSFPFDAVIATSCAEDDPDLAELREIAVAEMTPREAKKWMLDAVAAEMGEVFLDAMYRWRYQDVKFGISIALNEAFQARFGDDLVLEWNMTNESEKLYLFILPRPDKVALSETALINLDRYSRDYIFSEEHAEMCVLDEKNERLSTLRKAWMRAIPEMLDLFEDIAGEGAVIGIDDVIEKMCWTDVANALEQGVPLEDILV